MNQIAQGEIVPIYGRCTDVEIKEKEKDEVEIEELENIVLEFSEDIK